VNRLMFRFHTGRWPTQDNLARVNCRDAGRLRHLSCGWCDTHRAPMFQCLCRTTQAFSSLCRGGDMPYIAPAEHRSAK